MHMYIDMTKVISLSNSAYEEMKSLKQPGDSFSDVVMKFVDKARQRPLMDFFGKWPGKDEEAKRIRHILEKDRKRFRTREVAF